MTQWYVKDLSKITGVSVQTLHHYDRIALLKPSLRLPNGYRLYSEQDLLKLQQILALKFFGFELTQIKTLLTTEVDMAAHFSMQAHFLREKAQGLMLASETLENILAARGDDKSIAWETIIKLIEVYRMTQQLEKTWAGRVLNSEELKQYANFESGLKQRFTEKDKQDFGKSWAELCAKVNANLGQDPKGEFAINLAKEAMQLINGLYGTEHANLRHAIWEKGYKTGKMDAEHAIAPEIVEWLDVAMDAYYRGRIYNLLDQISVKATSQLKQQWEDLMTEMCGETQSLKQSVIDAAMTDARVSVAAKQWLQDNSKSK